jgi:hypothetical protein
MSLLHVHVHSSRPSICCVSMFMLYACVYAACQCPCCVPMSMLHVHVHAACPCPCCVSMSKLLFHISMLHAHVHAACPCPCCMLSVIFFTFLYIYPNLFTLCHTISLFSTHCRSIHSPYFWSLLKTLLPLWALLSRCPLLPLASPYSLKHLARSSPLFWEKPCVSSPWLEAVRCIAQVTREPVDTAPPLNQPLSQLHVWLSSAIFTAYASPSHPRGYTVCTVPSHGSSSKLINYSILLLIFALCRYPFGNRKVILQVQVAGIIKFLPVPWKIRGGGGFVSPEFLMNIYIKQVLSKWRKVRMCPRHRAAVFFFWVSVQDFRY